MHTINTRYAIASLTSTLNLLIHEYYEYDDDGGYLFQTILNIRDTILKLKGTQIADEKEVEFWEKFITTRDGMSETIKLIDGDINDLYDRLPPR